MTLSRRDFLVRSTMAVGGAATLIGSQPRAWAAPSAADFPQPCAASAWKKHGVVLRPEEPWEDNFIENFMSSVEPLDGGRWRIFYSANSPKKGYIGMAMAEGVPGEKLTRHRAVLSTGEPDTDAHFSIGNVPKSWRIVCPTHIRLPDGRHRIYFFAEGRGGGRVAQRYVAAESNNGKHYKIIDPDLPCMYTVWDNTPDKKLRPGQTLDDILINDGAVVYQLPDGTFEMFVQDLLPVAKDDPRYVAHDNIPGKVRVIDRLTSEDGLKFGNRERKVLAPDKDDPIDTQFYMLTVTHTPKGRVGLLSWYRVQAGYMELEYCFSKDGIHWDRVRKPWLPRGKPGDADSVTVYQPTSIVPHDDQWWLFYSGVNYTHSTIETAKPADKPCSCVLLATTPSLWAT